MVEKEKGAATAANTPIIKFDAKITKKVDLQNFATKKFGLSFGEFLEKLDAVAAKNNANVVIISMNKDQELKPIAANDESHELALIKQNIMADVAKLESNTDEEKQYEIDIAEDYPEPSYLMEGAGIGTIPRGDIVAIKAKSKNGKTFLASIFAATILGAEWGQLRGREHGCNVMYADTEQNTPNVARVGRRIHQLCGWSLEQKNDRLTIFALRQMDMGKRWTFIEKKVNEKHPDCLIIDGIADLIADFNDIAASNAIIGNLMKLSAKLNMAIIFILHTNKNKDDNNMKGHLGTLAVQKCSDVFAVEKVGDVFNVTETECRNLPMKDFSFSLDSKGLPVPDATPGEKRNEKKATDNINKLKNGFENIFKKANKDALRYSELKELLMKSMSKSTAERWIKQAEINGVIVSENGGYLLNKELPPFTPI